MRSPRVLYAASPALAFLVLFVILISLPSSANTVDVHENSVNSAIPPLSSSTDSLNRLAFFPNPSVARNQRGLGYEVSGLLPTSSTAHVTASIPVASYDEQLGTTFTQNFSGIEYNVTAVAQSDTYGYGPAYLLNGLGSTGYWYQVGVSYDWPLTSGGYNPGFGMNYEVFDSGGVSVFPLSGGGGLSSIQVNSGDTVLLSLNFSATSRDVIMMTKDWNTGSNASQRFSAVGATSFLGLASRFADPNGFFTGLMTEWYHVEAFYKNDGESIFSNYTHALSSAWLWINEFNVATRQLLFSDATKLPMPLSSSPSKLQPFYSHGAYEAVNSFEFVTGFQPPPVQVLRPIPKPLSADVGQPVSLKCSASGGIPPFVYSWIFGDGFSATGQNVSHAFNTPGTMNIQCNVIDSLQTASQNATSIMVLSDPSFILQTVNPTSIDVEQMVTFAVQVTGGSGVYTYKWTGLPTGCSSSNIATLSCQATTTRTFRATANVTDSNGFSILSSPLSVTLYSDPILTPFTASPSKLDIGQTITFATSATGGSGNLSFVYNSLPTGCETSNSTNLFCTLTTTGTYRVILTVTDSNGFTVSSGRVTIVVNPDPTSTIVASSPSIDLGQTLTFTVATSGGTGPFSYAYVSSSLGCTGLASPSLSCTPSTVGNYTVEVIVTDATGQISTPYISVKVSPIIGISSFTTSVASLDTGQEFTLTLATTGGTSPLSYSYSGLPPNCPSINSPVLHCTPSISGPYLIQVTVTDHAGKTASSSLNVTVQQAQITGLSSNQEYLLLGGVITAFISAIIAAGLLLRERKEPSDSKNLKA